MLLSPEVSRHLLSFQIIRCLFRNAASTSTRRSEVSDFNYSQKNAFRGSETYGIGFNGSNPDLCDLGGDDDPSFEIEESVRCTRGSSTQSLSSLLPVIFF